MREKSNACRGLEGKQEGKRSFGKPRRSVKDKIKTNRKDIECEAVAWIDLAQARDQCQALANKALNLRVTQIAWNFLTSRGT
jgi:hypothetical protein